MDTPAAARLERLGEHSWLVTLGADLDVVTSRRVLALAAWVRDQRRSDVLDVVAAIGSLAVHAAPSPHARERVGRLLEARLAAGAIDPVPEGPLREIPVRYGGTDGPDLDGVAAQLGITADDVIVRHAAVTYHVFMLGFLPGFPYLGPVDPSIRVPRRPAPRVRVPAGSVGLADAQTGIYPRESPGGWQLIGRTDVRLFAPDASPHCRLTPGDRVRFLPA